jgi:hypothetical protein
MRELTAAVNRIQTVPLMLEQILGENHASVSNRHVSVEEQSQSIAPAPSVPLNANPPVDDNVDRKVSRSKSRGSRRAAAGRGPLRDGRSHCRSAAQPVRPERLTWGLYPALHRTLSVGIVQLGGRSSPASQPTASVFMGSMGTAILSVRSQVEHSNVRSSNPRVPGEIRASAILCLHTGHIGRSLIASPITLPQDHRQRTCCSLIM